MNRPGDLWSEGALVEVLLWRGKKRVWRRALVVHDGWTEEHDGGVVVAAWVWPGAWECFGVERREVRPREGDARLTRAEVEQVEWEEDES